MSKPSSQEPLPSGRNSPNTPKHRDTTDLGVFLTHGHQTAGLPAGNNFTSQSVLKDHSARQHSPKDMPYAEYHVPKY